MRRVKYMRIEINDIIVLDPIGPVDWRGPVLQYRSTAQTKFYPVVGLRSRWYTSLNSTSKTRMLQSCCHIHGVEVGAACVRPLLVLV